MSGNLRLNAQHRRTILDRVTNSEGFAKRREALARQGHELAAATYNTLFPAEVRRSAHVLSVQQSKQWVNCRQTMRVNVAGATIDMLHAKPVPLPGGYTNYTCGVLEAGDLAEEIMRWVAAKEQLAQDSNRAYYVVEGILKSVGTVKKLREAWPEGAKFYDDLEPVKVPLPALVSSDVNALLGLKPVGDTEGGA